jgi:DNA-binding PadR family transcriptional regulator
MSGYDLRKFIESSTSNFWSESYAQIYPMLKQLTREGLTIFHTEKQEGRPERYVYELTEKGWNELRSWLAEPIEPVQTERNELLLKLFFGRQIPVAQNLEHVQQFRLTLIQAMQKYEEIRTMLAEHTDRSDAVYWRITLSYGVHVTRSLVEWCDETIALLHEVELPSGKGTSS